MGMAIDIKGSRELERALREIGDDRKTLSRIIGPAGRKAVKPVLTAAKLMAAEDTGLLAQSLGIKTQRPRGGGIRFRVGPRPGFRRRREGDEWVKSTTKERGGVYKNPQYYAHLVEFGTAPHTVRFLGKQKVDHPGTPARPFLRPAWDMHEGSLNSVFEALVWRGLQAEWARRKSGG